MRKALHDHPFRVDVAVLALVAIHWALTVPTYPARWKIPSLPNLWSGIATAEPGTARDLYAAMLGPSAIVAGFAGVVVVFGLTSDAPRFRKFRADAGDSLKRTWVSSSLSGFLAGLAFVLAALLSFAGASESAPFLFEAGLLVLIHGAARLVWILRALIGIKTADDEQAVRQDSEVKLDRMPWNRSA